MNGAVEIVLRRGDVVVELAGNELPERVHDPQRPVAIGNAVHEHPRRANVHQLLEGQLFGLHLSPDAEDVFGPRLDGRFDAGAAHRDLAACDFNSSM